MKTIIFGGSFDPIHNGHIEIAKMALETIKADRVIFMLAKKPRWKSINTNENHRLEMLRIALEGIKEFEISLLEYNSNVDVNYTIDTIKSFNKQEGEELYFLIGNDQLSKLHNWKDIDELSSLVQFICVDRKGDNINYHNIEKYHIKFFDKQISDTSSTSIRELKSVDVNEKVLRYIINNDLYFINKVRYYINDKRYDHSISVALLAYSIAKSNYLDCSKAFIGGLLHDIGKNVREDIQLKYMQKNYPEYTYSIHKALYHQYLSENIARNDFKVDDEEILDAIKYHATGKDNMSVYAKIIYASDKIDPLRGYDSSHLINACMDNIDSGFIKVLDENIEFLKKTNKEFSNPLTLKCIKYYLGD